METVRAADHERYLATLYAPEDKRGDLAALYAFNAEVAAVRDRVSQPLPGEIRLQWWRDAIASGQGAGGHPVAEALLETISRRGLPVTAFDRFLEARIFDLYDDPMPSRTDLEGYCGDTASALIQLSAMILDADAAPSVAELSGHAGCAQAIAGMMRRLPLHRARGQCFVPAEMLAAAGTNRDEFVSSVPGQGGARAVAAMAALAGEHLGAFERGAKSMPRTLRPAFLPLALTGAYLAKVAGKEERVLTGAVEISAVRRHWLVFRRASRGWS